MKVRKMLAAAAIAAGAAAAGHGTSFSAEATRPGFAGFGSLRAVTPDAARTKVDAYLKAAGKFDAAAVDAVWSRAERSLVDRVADALAVGDAEVAAVLADARNPDSPAPLVAPAVLRDTKRDAFFRANVGVAYAKALAAKRVYEEALDALAPVPPEQAVDPAAYYFYKAVAEHALIKREQATQSITRLLDDVADAPDRYKMVATLMFFEMQNWAKDPKDLSNIGRLMDNSGRRLDLARAGEKTQDIQKKIVFRLDEIIKEMENQSKGGGQSNGGNCPNGGNGAPGGNTTNPNNPANDSVIMGGAGQGKVDEKRLRQYAESWGTLPAADRAKAIQEITRDLPPKYKPIIEEYFKSLNRVNGFDNP